MRATIRLHESEEVFISRTVFIIKSEHRSLASVLHGILYLVEKIRNHGYAPDFALLRAMLYYIDAFPERLHHPKEDRYLFAALRRRAPEMGSVLDELKKEHEEGAILIRKLQQTLLHYEQMGNTGFASFAASVDNYANFHWRHMRKEEEIILPAAEQKLTDQDWKEIDKAFAENTDPIEGGDGEDEFKALFSRITNLAPAPIGLGPAIE